MKKLYRIPLLLIAFIFLSTYSPNKFGLTLEEKYTFFEIKNIKIVNNFLIRENVMTFVPRTERKDKD